MHHQLLIGLLGPELTSAERQYLRRFPPRGVILFARNIETPAQVARLLAEAREVAGADLWAAIDEEGGRVNRLPWPPFNNRLPAASYGQLWQSNRQTAAEQLFADNQKVAEALSALGFTHNCAPVLDLFWPQGDGIIGNRAYGETVDVVSELATACLRGLVAGGIAGVGKHWPGHGRADADSHLALPHVSADLPTLLAEASPYKSLINAGLGHIMTAHVHYDAAPEQEIATNSRWWLKLLRDEFGFGGNIWSDDLNMAAAGSDLFSAMSRAGDAGCDTLLVCQPAGINQLLAEAAHRWG